MYQAPTAGELTGTRQQNIHYEVASEHLNDGQAMAKIIKTIHHENHGYGIDKLTHQCMFICKSPLRRNVGLFHGVRMALGLLDILDHFGPFQADSDNIIEPRGVQLCYVEKSPQFVSHWKDT